MLRERVLEQIRLWLPSELGDGRFDQMLGPQNGPGKWAYWQLDNGNTCGVIAAALLEFAGGPAELINRGPTFQPGAHISRMIAAAKKLGAWRTDTEGMESGDLYVLSVPPKYTNTHAGYFLEHLGGGWIKTADGGQKGKNGREAALYCQRHMTPGGISIPGGGGYRPFHGRVALSALPGAGSSETSGTGAGAVAAAAVLTLGIAALLAD